MLAFAMLTPGCFSSHLLPTEGERYTCTCEWNLCIPIDPCARYDDMHRCIELRTGLPCLAGVPPERHLTFPCSPVLFPTDETRTGFCDEFCRDRAPAPAFAGSAGRALGPATHLGPGVCSESGDPSRIYFEPVVPTNAIRRGRVVPELSSVRMDLLGIGTAVVTPDDTGEIFIQGGGCDTDTCPMWLNFFNVFLPTFSLDGREVLDGHAGMAGALDIFAAEQWDGRYTAQPVRPDTWELFDPVMPLPIELTGIVPSLAPSRVRVSFASWGHDMFDRDVLPGRVSAIPPFERLTAEIDIRRNALPHPFIQLIGRAVADFDLADGMHTAVVDFDVHYQFFDGSPHTMALIVGSPSDSNEIVLDGRETWVDVGGPVVDYYWTAADRDPPIRLGAGEPAARQLLFALGPLASVPRTTIEGLRAQGLDRICLRAVDSGGLYSETCGSPEQIGVWPPDLPPPGCADVGLSTPDTTDFRTLLDGAGWTEYVNTYPGLITLIVPTNEMVATLPPGYRREVFVNPAVRARYVGQFIRPDVVLTAEEVARMRFVPGSPLPIVPVMPNRGCGDGGIVQVIRRSGGLSFTD